MVNLQFTLVETLWKTFWRFSQSQAGDATLAVWVWILKKKTLKIHQPTPTQNVHLRRAGAKTEN